MMFRILMIEDLISDSNTAQIFDVMFSWWFKFDWWFNRIIVKTLCQSRWSESESTLEREFVCESRLSRRFVCFECQTTQTNESIMLRFCLHSQRAHCCLLRCFLRMIERYESIMLHYHWTLWEQNALFI